MSLSEALDEAAPASAVALSVVCVPTVSSGRDSTFLSAGVRIRYIDRGEGEPVILLHGYTADIEDQWVETGVVRELARSNRVIAFDARGHGRSDKPHETAAYGANMAHDVVRLLDHLGIDRAHVVGYSMGAHIVAQLLTLHPRRLLSATLGGAAGRRNWTRADDLRVEAEAAEMEEGRLDTQILRLWPANTPKPTRVELDALSAVLLRGKDPRALAAVRRSNREQVVTDAEMAVVEVPVLGIVGSADAYLADFHALARAMPQIKLVTIEGAAHGCAPQRPEFVRALRDFMRSK